MVPKKQAKSAIVSREMTETELDEQREEERVDKSMSTFKNPLGMVGLFMMPGSALHQT